MVNLPKKVTVLVDSREKLPLIFPENVRVAARRDRTPQLIRVTTQSERLETGDYTLRGTASRVIVERKGSFGELSQNLMTKDRARAFAALTRLAAETTNPYLLLDMGGPHLWTPNEYCGDTGLVFDELFRVLGTLRIRPLFWGFPQTLGGRRAAGELALRLLIYHSFLEETPNGSTSTDRGCGPRETTGQPQNVVACRSNRQPVHVGGPLRKKGQRQNHR